ncbi:MAG: RHS repeat-associated core domain-containing protein, partial [Clostridia bacterium]|nr:RHS repeat-associated core domain-containing protein [Clostridia bacterium]
KSNDIIPLYDTSEAPIGIIHSYIDDDGNKISRRYWYAKNLQGDILALRDDTGADVVRYVYDAWGKVTVGRDNSGVDLADINPFRYRGYLYDYEFGLYYLQSRYYDPETCRFINMDDAILMTIEMSTRYANLFTYCANNPINNIDPSGFFYIKLTTLADIILKVVGFNPVGAALIAIGLYKAKVYITAKMALLGARLGKFWGPIVCAVLTSLFALLGLTVGGQIAEALWDCAWLGKKGIEFTVRKNRWGWPYKLDIYAK